MSRRETDREDLLREATALVERAELSVPVFADAVVAGFRRDGATSFFFGADPVYQFNAAGELRRAYVGGLLYKAERGRLVSLRRERLENEVALVRTELSSAAAEQIVADMAARLAHLRDALMADRFQIVGQVPADAPVASRLTQWLTNLPAPIVVARQPNVR